MATVLHVFEEGLITTTDEFMQYVKKVGFMDYDSKVGEHVCLECSYLWQSTPFLSLINVLLVCAKTGLVREGP